MLFCVIKVPKMVTVSNHWLKRVLQLLWCVSHFLSDFTQEYLKSLTSGGLVVNISTLMLCG